MTRTDTERRVRFIMRAADREMKRGDYKAAQRRLLAAADMLERLMRYEAKQMQANEP